MDDEGLHAVFDVGNVPSWVLGGRVRQIWFGQGLAMVVRASAHDDAQELSDVALREGVGEDWSFSVDPSYRSAVEGRPALPPGQHEKEGAGGHFHVPLHPPHVAPYRFIVV